MSYPAMTEAHLDREVRRLLSHYGLRGYHTRDSRGSQAGFPDWVIVGPGGVLWRELKSPYGALTSAQVQWKYDLLAAGQNWADWRPLDWESGRIAAELAVLKEV